MNALQKKAIVEAIRLIDSFQVRPIYAENFVFEAELRIAANVQKAVLESDSVIRRQAVERLKSALE